MSAGPPTDPRYEPTLLNPAEFVSGGTPVRLPQRLSEDYDFIEELPRRGAEALLLRARPRSGGDDVVIKLYRQSLQERGEVLKAILGREVAHIAQLLDYGSVDGVGYEVLEWIPQGDLGGLVASHGGALPENLALVVLRELASAVTAFHGLRQGRLAHGDIKPANVLVRSTEPLDLVLGDFGRATFDATKVNPVPTTPRWSPPEDLVTAPEGDWWQAGCVVQFCLTGRVPFDGLSEADAVRLRGSRNFPLEPLPEGLERDWSLLLKGLLTREYIRRWGSSEVTAWLAGAEVPLPPEWVTPEPITIATPAEPPTEPIRFDGNEYHDLLEFAVGLARGWDRAVGLLATPSGAEAMAEALNDYAADIHDLDLAARLQHLQDQTVSPERRLAWLITGLDPGLPPTFRQVDVTWAGLAGLADEAAGDPVGCAAGAVTSLAETAALPGYDGTSSGGDYSRLHRDWDEQVAVWLGLMRAHAGEPDGRQWTVARARVLSALVDPAARQRLTRQGRRAGGRTARRVAWFGDLRAGADTPGRAIAAVMLAPAAEAQARQARALDEAAEERRSRDRDAAATLRWPRTTRCLRWSAAPLAVLLIGTVLWHLLPRWGLSPLASPASWIAWWTRHVPRALGPWLAQATAPVLVLPPLVAAVVLLWRSRNSGGAEFVSRHPLERRAMQAVVLYVSLLVPVLLPVMLLGWVNGLRQYASDDLYRRRGIRTASLLVGSVGVTTAALLAWSLPWTRVPASSWSWNWRVLSWLESNHLERIADPLALAVSATTQGDRAPFVLIAVLLSTCAVGSVVLGGLDYVRRTSPGTVAMWVLVLPTSVLALNGFMAYGLLAQSPFIDVGWLIVIVFVARHRWRTRREQRGQRR